MTLSRQTLLIFFLLLISGLAKAAPTTAPLVFGVFPYVTPGQLMAYHSPLKTYLESKLQQTVELVTAPDFSGFLSRTHESQYDLILTAPHMGRLAERQDGYVRIAKTGHEVQGVFLARRDSGIHRLSDLRGKKVMIAQPISVVYQMAVDHLKVNGLMPDKDVTILPTRTHNNSLYAPMRQEADASVTGTLLWTNADEKVRAEQIEIGRTQAVPGFMIMANRRLSPAQVQRIQQLLLDFENTPEGKAYFKSTDLKFFEKIDDKTMKLLDPYTSVLTDSAS